MEHPPHRRRARPDPPRARPRARRGVRARSRPLPVRAARRRVRNRPPDPLVPARPRHHPLGHPSLTHRPSRPARPRRVRAKHRHALPALQGRTGIQRRPGHRARDGLMRRRRATRQTLTRRPPGGRRWSGCSTRPRTSAAGASSPTSTPTTGRAGSACSRCFSPGPKASKSGAPTGCANSGAPPTSASTAAGSANQTSSQTSRS